MFKQSHAQLWFISSLPGNSWGSLGINIGEAVSPGQFGYGHPISRPSLPFQGECDQTAPAGLRTREGAQDICVVLQASGDLK